MRLAELLDYATETLRDSGFKDPRFEARQLVQELLGIDAASVLLQTDKVCDSSTVQRAQAWLQRRKEGYPLAYLAGHKGFYQDDFIVYEGVLIPRPETELVVDIALKRSSDLKRIADFGCGTGCIGLSVLKAFPMASLVAIDASELACQTAKENARRLNLESRVQVQTSRIQDFKSPTDFDLIVANPPYIAHRDPNVEPHVHRYEPQAALYSEDNGLEQIKEWAGAAFSFLSPNGILVMEIGSEQGRKVEAFFRSVGFGDIQIYKDLACHDRVVSGRKIAKTKPTG